MCEIGQCSVMPYLDITDTFDPDSFDAEVIGLATSLGDHDSGSHMHQRGQLLFARRGCIRITLADRLCLLPPLRAVWIPPQTLHRHDPPNSRLSVALVRQDAAFVAR